jgi:chaperone LolA
LGTKQFLIFLLLVLSIGMLSFVSEALPKKKSSPEVESLKQVLAKYKNSKFTQAEVERTLVQSLQGRTTTSAGQVFLSGPLFRLELKNKEENLIVFDGKKLWTETRKESEKQPQVTSIKMGAKAQSQMLLNEVFAQGKLLEKFNILKTEKVGDSIQFQLEPNKNLVSVSALRVSIDPKNLVVVDFTYVDDLENETNYKFKNQKFNQKMNTKKFKYTPPKGVLVNEL